MALQGKFIVNNEPLSPVTMFGVGTFMAFSGDDIYRNRGGCTAVAGKGPLPAGKYWIVDRPSGGIGSRVEAWTRDTWNTVMGAPSNHSEWFALYRDDASIDDWTWVNGVKRGNFRLHPVGGGGHSYGCITLQSLADFRRLRQALLQTSTVLAGDSGIRAYGWIEVIADGDTCP
ncbi:DUF2778 domain-containing protein [Paraburkholderia edwinii]|jgi:hypothetical protein|uniref:DUF2778 domain-containing protein n=1 Tax=Paraburkholderia edwinii TaxID=2861782 RepID=A0ABX8UNM3_9BURK|nr:DUF2778 domain-containing protein [Paraburkholderia edwinii]QYD68558.1 DUF2778 domain-containing protein [Paraburkholderia edwinii]